MQTITMYGTSLFGDLFFSLWDWPNT